MSEPVILVIEDGVETQATLQRDFTKLGCKVVVTGSGEEALEKLAGGFNPDVIILDFLLPKMSGPEFYRKLRNQKEIKVPPIIPFTSTLDNSSPGGQGAISDFINVRTEIDQPQMPHPIVSKGGEEIAKTPSSLVVAVSHCLRQAHVDLPAPLKQKLRLALSNLIESFED